jgi:hypothetical protein
MHTVAPINKHRKDWRIFSFRLSFRFSVAMVNGQQAIQLSAVSRQQNQIMWTCVGRGGLGIQFPGFFPLFIKTWSDISLTFSGIICLLRKLAIHIYLHDLHQWQVSHHVLWLLIYKIMMCHEVWYVRWVVLVLNATKSIYNRNRHFVFYCKKPKIETQRTEGNSHLITSSPGSRTSSTVD